MGSIPKRDTRPELVLRSALGSIGVKGWRCHSPLPGSPDIAFTRWKVAVFVDGVWWHGHPDYRPNGRKGPYWDAKIASNMERDGRVSEELRAAGWIVLRIWDIEVLAEPEAMALRVVDALKTRGWSPARAAVPDEVLVERETLGELVSKTPAASRASAKQVAEERGRYF